MDIFRFINSKDIREYLKNINYQFSSLETAWLIYQCRDATIEEKHRAWEEVIRTMPDCRIEKRMNTMPQESLHAFLQEYMQIEDELIDAFGEDHPSEPWHVNKPFVYRFNYLYDVGEGEESTVFSHFDALFELMAEPKEYITGIQVTKMQIDNTSCSCEARMDPEFHFMEISPRGLLNEHQAEIYFEVFFGLWFDFPTPFKRGDIVWNPDRYFEGPLVLEHVNLEGIDCDRIKTHIRKNGDWSDMAYRTYFLSPGEGVYIETGANYMDLEYYPKELKDTEQALLPISEFLQGKVGIDYCCQKYHKVFGENIWLDGATVAYDEYKKMGEHN